MVPMTAASLIVGATIAFAPGVPAAEPPEDRGGGGVEHPAPRVDSLLTIARIRYGGGGDWYADPTSLPNLLSEIRERTGLPVADRETEIAPTDPALRNHPYLYLTGHGNVRFTAAERASLREPNPYILRQKLYRHLRRKGYEPELIGPALARLLP